MTLDEVLALWRVHRTAELADLVDAIAATVKLPKVPRTGIQLAWQELKPKDHVTLAALLPLLTRSVPVQQRVKPWRDNASRTRLRAWCTRVARLAKCAPDPRIAAALVAVVRDPPFEMGDPFTGQWLYQPVLDILVVTADDRGLPTLRDLLAKPTATTKNLRDFFAIALPPVIAAIEAVPRTPYVATSPDVAALIASREPMTAPAIARDDEATLVEAVVADLDADGPRVVLGDYWQQHDQPQGELVALQLLPVRTPEQATRMSKLLRDDRWLGEDLRRVTLNRRYVRGMLDSIDLQASSVTDAGGWERAAADPALATVREIGRGAAREASYVAFATSPQARSLRFIQISAKSLATVAASPAFERIEHLAFDTRPTPVTLATIATFPHLRRLTLVTDVAHLASIAETIAGWPERVQLEEICARVRYIISNVRDAAAWLREGERFGVERVSLHIGFDTIDRIALGRGRHLYVEGDGHELVQLAGQLGRMKRVELATHSADLKARFKRAKPDELVQIERSPSAALPREDGAK